MYSEHVRTYSVCLCVCMCVRMYVCVCTCVCMYVCAYVCMYVCVCACVNTDTVYFEAGPLNQSICVAPLATPPLNFYKLVTNCSYPRAPLCMRTALQHTYTINNDIICSVNVTL